MKRARPDSVAVALLCPTAVGLRRVQELYSELSADRVTCQDYTQLAPYVGQAATPALDRAVAQYVRAYPKGLRRFVERVLRPTACCALEFPQLFTLDAQQGQGQGRTLVAPNPPRLALSRRQLYCVVANAFFNTFGARDQDTMDCFPTIAYDEMHVAPDGENDVEVVKLRLLFDYFARAGSLTSSAAAAEGFVVYRPSVPPNSTGQSTARLAATLVPPVVHELGESIDDQRHMLRLDFANRWIGGGALSDGCVQEEITFAQCPELNALRWLHGPMADDEAIVVAGYRQYAAMRTGTYGYGVKYGRALPRALRLDGALVAVDAIDYRYETPATQYGQCSITRELAKLLAGLSVPALDAVQDVAGGNWGCGVFGGNVELKFLIQWLACALCGKTLHYFPFDKPALAVYGTTAGLLCRQGLSGRTLLRFLMQLEETHPAAGEEGSNVMGDLLLYVNAQSTAPALTA